MSYSPYVKQAERFVEQLKPGALYDRANLEMIKEYAYYLIDSVDEPADKFIKNLENHLANLHPQSEEEQESLDIASYWLLRLKSFFFFSLSAVDKENFFRSEIVLALKEGIDVWPGVEDYLRLFSSEDIPLAIGMMTRSLISNKIQLSSQLNMGQLIAAYKDYLGKRFLGNARPSSADVISFINTSELVHKLNELERPLAGEILKLYTRLLSFRGLEFRVQSRPLPSPVPKASPPTPPPPAARLLLGQEGMKKVLPPAPRPPTPPPSISTTPSPFGGHPSLKKEWMIQKQEGGEPKVSLNEELYRKTLEELKKQKEEVENNKLNIKNKKLSETEERKTIRGGAVEEGQKVGGAPSFQIPAPLSVNEAIIHAGQQDEPTDHAEVVPGAKPGEEEMEEKLKRLEEKIK